MVQILGRILGLQNNFQLNLTSKPMLVAKKKIRSAEEPGNNTRQPKPRNLVATLNREVIIYIVETGHLPKM